MYVIFGNYGNNTIALIQWAKENNLEQVSVVHSDTGWSAPSWLQRIETGQQLAQAYSFQTITLQSQKTFPDLIKERNAFPTKKFQWCTSFLKALPFVTWLDEQDPNCEATILLGSRRCDSRARANLPEFIVESEHYNERKVWYPLYAHDHVMRNDLIKRSGLELLTHRSLECDPCIHNSASDFNRLSTTKIAQIAELEKICKQTMFTLCDNKNSNSISSVVDFYKNRSENPDKALESFDMGCGSHYVCGE